jgi:short-subunit dehydrogenase
MVRLAMSVDLNGARVLVTGATGGIGQAIARAVHARGARALVTGRRREVLDSLVAELGDSAESLPADLASADDVRALVERAGRVDVLVANAALPGSGRLDDYSPEEIDRAIDVNLRAPMQLARALAPPMVERGSGHLVLVSSLSGKVASAQASIYNATKFGLRGFGFALHDELRETGVGVTTVFPGFIADAGMFAEADVKLPPGVGTRTPEQVADAVVTGIEKNRAEIDVAPVGLRLGGWLFGASPSFVSAITRRFGGAKVSEALSEGQRDKR